MVLQVNWFEAKLKDETNNTGIRMFKRYAVITTSAKILGRVLSTNIDIANIRYFVIIILIQSLNAH